MEEKDLISRLEKIYNDMEEFETDETLRTLAKVFGKIKDEVNDLLSDLETKE